MLAKLNGWRAWFPTAEWRSLAAQANGDWPPTPASRREIVTFVALND